MTTDRITSGAERALLENMLDRNRAALVGTVRGLSDADARRRLVPSLTTPISLLKPAAGAERIWFQRFWAGLDTKVNPREGTVSLRWTLLSMIEEMARHAGHGDILREQIDQLAST